MKAQCVNGCKAPVQHPSKVLCANCLAALDAKMRALLGQAPESGGGRPSRRHTSKR